MNLRKLSLLREHSPAQNALRDATGGTQLGNVAEHLHRAVERPDREQHGERFAEPVAHFDRTRRLLDEIGWSERNPERDAEIDLDQHRQAIIEALTDQLAVERDMVATGRKDRDEVQRQLASARAHTITTWAQRVGLQLDASRHIIPAEFRPLLTECLLGVMQDAAADVEGCGFDAEAYPEPLERLDRIRAALDATGWGAGADIDLGAHRDALQDALSDRLETEHHLVSEQGQAAKKQRQRACRYALQIEAWAESVGLEVK